MDESNHSDYEEEDFEGGLRASRKERKRRQTRDRSKYKKSDLDQRAKQQLQIKRVDHEKKGRILGRVLSVTGLGIIVAHDHQTFLCTLRGVLKKEIRRIKNLVTVGDFVWVEKNNDKEGWILDVEPRKSSLSRAESLTKRREQLIAANIDQVLITSSVVSPELKPFLIDRYIISARKGNMEPVVVINKIDLLESPEFSIERKEQQESLLRETLEAYSKANIQAIAVSVVTGEGLEKLHQTMKDKSSVFSGQSGVGKSSLINEVAGTNFPTGDVVEKTRKGAHTTSTAHLLPLSFGGWCIDTPGIKSFGVWDLQHEDLDQYYDEIHEFSHGCFFKDCSHTHEKGCAVIQAVQEGKISPIRYESYATLFESIQQKDLSR